MRRLVAVVSVAVVALVSAAPSDAHVIAQPPFLPAGELTTIALSGPNEREVPMTGFRIRLPNGFRIASVHAPADWSAELGENEVRWSGGPLPPAGDVTFHVELEAPAEPGAVTLETEQLYPGGEAVSWPVLLTVVPGSDSPEENLGWALLVGIVGLFVIGGVALLAWLRRPRGTPE
jgi:hypothetical protein